MIQLPRGRDAAQTIGDLAESYQLPRRAVERVIEDMRRAGVPVCSGSAGVWLATTAQEALEHAEALRSRAIHQLDTASSLKDAGEAWAWREAHPNEVREAKVEALTLGFEREAA